MITNVYFSSASEASKNFSIRDNDLKIFQLNVRGISNTRKFNHVRTLLTSFSCNFDVVVLTEVKLKSNFPVQIYSIRGFRLYYCLRSAKGGGGLLVYVNTSIPSEQVLIAPTTFECLQLNITIGASNYRIFAVYRAPDPSNFNDFMNNLEELTCGHGKTIIVGDLNINSPNLTIRPATKDNNSKLYSNLLAGFGYKVTNNLPTRPCSGKTIDHVVTNFNETSRLCNYTVEIDPELSDHNAIITSFSADSNRPRQIHEIIKHKLKLESLAGNLPQPPEDLFSSTDSNFVADSLIHALQIAISSSTSIRKFSVKHEERICEWSSDKTLCLMSEKDKLLRKRRNKPRSAKIKNDLVSVSTTLTRSIQNDFQCHVKNKVSTKDPKKMWRGLNEILGRNKLHENIVLKNPRTMEDVPDPNDVAELFNEIFATCASSPSTSSNALNPIFVETSHQSSFFLQPPDEDEINRQICNLRANSADGHDKIGPKVIKTLAAFMVPILTHLVKVIFETGIYPETFKLALVVPIFKDGSKLVAENYRPISVLPVLDKIVERILRDRLSAYFDGKLKAAYSHQFGFREKCSTENAAIELVNEIAQAREKKLCTTGLFMDLKKAFDIVNHEILLKILEHYGIRGMTNQLLRSFLTNRRQVVKVGSVTSHERTIDSGVIQGSCLGPLLFSIFINAIGSLPTKGRLFLFADDAVLVNVHESRQAFDIIDTISQDLELVVHFFQQRKMQLNSKKTKLVSFTTGASRVDLPTMIEFIPGLVIEKVPSVKYLGLVLSDNLSWSAHLESLEKKLAPASGILWKLRFSLPQHTRRLIYDTLFQTHLNYLTPVWGFSPISTIYNAQILQNRALRNVYNLPWRAPRCDMYLHRVENHLPIRGLCVLNTAVFIYKAIHHQTHTNLRFVNANYSHNICLRNSSSLRPQLSKTKVSSLGIMTVGPQVFNKIPEPIKSLRTPFIFRWALRCHLRQHDFISSCFDKTFFNLKI